MIKTMNHYIKYISLLKLIAFEDAISESIMTYDVKTVWIQMKYRDVFIKEIYYILAIIINLFYSHDLLISDYWIELQQDYSFKVTEWDTDDLTDFITTLNWEYIICTQKFQIKEFQIKNFKIERFVLAAILNNLLYLWYL